MDKRANNPKPSDSKNKEIPAPRIGLINTKINRKKPWKVITFMENFCFVAEIIYLSLIVPWFLRTNKIEKTAKSGAYMYNTRSLSWYVIPRKEQNKAYARKEKTISLRLYDQKGVCFFEFIKASIISLMIPKPAKNLKDKVIKGV